MSAIKYFLEIGRKYPDENPEDFIMMIEILAEERARALDTELSDTIYDYAATILCTLFDSVKLQDYIDDIFIVRGLFVGIAKDNELQASFRKSMTKALLEAATPQEAIRGGVKSLFLVEFYALR